MKKILAILLAFTMLLSLTAYGSSTAPASGSTKSDQSADAVGNYKLTGQTGNIEKNMNDVLNIVKLGSSLYLSLKEDGTGSMQLLDAEIPLKWDDSDIIIHPQKGHDLMGPARIPYTCEDETLEIKAKDYSLTFTRLTKEELAEYNENSGDSLKGLLKGFSQMVVGNIEDGLGDLLFLALVLGSKGNETPSIPEGEPSEGSVTGTVNGISFTILGADRVQGEETPLIVFYFEATNTTDDCQEFWSYNFDASQKGAFLEQTWDHGDIPEEYNTNLGIAPGRTLRCACVFEYDPDDGVVGFRISCLDDKDNTVLYYADPGNLTGAPAEPFVFDKDPSVPEYVQALPAEIEQVRIENAEFYTDEDGDKAVRFYFTFRNTTGKDGVPFYQNYSCYALQDGIQMALKIPNEPHKEESNYGEEIKSGEEILCASSYKLRTGSPVSFVVYEDKGFDEKKIYVAAKTYEVE